MPSLSWILAVTLSLALTSSLIVFPVRVLTKIGMRQGEKGRLFLDVVVSECVVVWKLLTVEDKALLVGKDAFLVLDLSHDVIARVNVELDCLSGQSLDKDRHETGRKGQTLSECCGQRVCDRSEAAYW